MEQRQAAREKTGREKEQEMRDTVVLENEILKPLTSTQVSTRLVYRYYVVLATDTHNSYCCTQLTRTI